jgi:CTP-dependent riboflavin kinase
MRTTGKVVRGLEESGKFLTIPWVANQIKERLSFFPYPGTLNIKLDDTQVQAELKERARERIIHQEMGFVMHAL